MSFVYPNRCLFCGEITEEKTLICKNCFDTICPIDGDVCDTCGREKQHCNCKVGDFAFVRNIGSFYYEAAVKTIVSRFKFRKCPQLSDYIAKYMIKNITDKYSDFTFDFITFVPSSKIKIVKRGYNPAELLAENVSKGTNIILRDVLSAKFRLKPQKYTDYKMRQKQVKGKFLLKQPDIAGQRILLIDDVMTSGATLNECAKVLKKGGAKSVVCATFAITLKK